MSKISKIALVISFNTAIFHGLDKNHVKMHAELSFIILDISCNLVNKLTKFIQNAQLILQLQSNNAM